MGLLWLMSHQAIHLGAFLDNRGQHKNLRPVAPNLDQSAVAFKLKVAEMSVVPRGS